MNRRRWFLIISIFLTFAGVGIGIKNTIFFGDYRTIILDVWILLGIIAYWSLYLFGGKESAKTKVPRAYRYLEKQDEQTERSEERHAQLDTKCLELEEELAELEMRLADIRKEIIEEEWKLASTESPLKKPTSGRLH